MIKLTDRLRMLADQIEQNETMADIGTDHGFLPIYLWENQISPKVVMADISTGSLDKARANAESRYPGRSFDLRLGDGIQVLENGEVDAVVIAGMGGALMTRILGKDLAKSKSFKKLVLQPRSGQGVLRHWLINHGFAINAESLVREGKYLCEIITARPLEYSTRTLSWEMAGCGPDDMEYEAPPWIFSAGPLANELIKNKLTVEEKILRNLHKSKTVNEEKMRFTENRIKYLTKLLRGD